MKNASENIAERNSQTKKMEKKTEIYEMIEGDACNVEFCSFNELK